MKTTSIKPSYGLCYLTNPQVIEPDGTKSWVTRSANVVVVVSEVKAGTSLTRDDNLDEYMLLLSPGMRALVQSAGQSVQAGPESLTIIPPGKSSIHFLNEGLVARVFSVRASDLVALASNSYIYFSGAPLVMPLEDWPMPIDGYKIRNYALAEYSNPKIFGRVFRSRNLMINIFDRKSDRRDPRKLSPHSHADFEQISLTLEGTFVHHLRTPWTPDSTEWCEDEHVEVHSPSTTVIPTNLIHTTQDIGDGVVWLIDIFGPPRLDFSNQPGVVRNSDEYPLPIE